MDGRTGSRTPASPGEDEMRIDTAWTALQQQIDHDCG
jgi:hypothetical protein